MFGLAKIFKRLNYLEDTVRFLLNRKGEDVAVSLNLEEDYFTLIYICGDSIKKLNLKGLDTSHPISVEENNPESVIIKHKDCIYKLDKRTQQIVNITEFYPSKPRASKDISKYEEEIDY